MMTRLPSPMRRESWIVDVSGDDERVAADGGRRRDEAIFGDDAVAEPLDGIGERRVMLSRGIASRRR
jgi:hypothetical protein